MMQRSLSVVLLVIGSMAGVVWLYAMCLFIICVYQGDGEIGMKALEQFKDFGIFAAGALSGFLARTTTGSEPDPAATTKTEIVNTQSNPVPTTESEK